MTDKLGVFNVSFNAANASCDGSVCQDPVPMLLAISFAFGKAEELAESQGDTQKLRDLGTTMEFLSSRIATLHNMMDPAAPSVHNLSLKYPRDSEGRKGQARQLLWDVARGFARRVPLTKLVHLDADIRPYLTALLIAALYHHRETLILPEGMKYKFVPMEEF